MLKKLKLYDYIKILIIVIIITIVIITSKYIGLLDILGKLIKSILPILLAIGISFINEPLINKLLKYIKRKYAVLMIYLFELIITIFVVMLIIPSLIEQLEKFFKELPIIYDLIISKFEDLNFNFDISKTIGNYSVEILTTVSGVIEALVNVGIAFVGAFFLSFDFVKFKNKIKEILIKYKKEKVVIYLKNFLPFIHKYIFCLLIDMVILLIISGVSFWLAGLEYPFMFATIIALCDLIPLIGPFIGGAPAVIVALTGSFKFAILILVIILLAQFIESNITKPCIMKNAIFLHPLEGLIGIAIGGALFGFLGLILSPIFITGIKIYINLKKEEKI